MRFSFLFMGLVFCTTGFCQTIHYAFSAPNAVHHEAEITLTVNGLPAGPATFRMSRSSPGRYATHEFGKNIYQVKAFDRTGKRLPMERTSADEYRLTRHKGEVKITYTLYGNHADGTYAEIDPTHYHLNMPASFLWVKGHDKVPITIHFKLPHAQWKIATQLMSTDDPATFTAPGLQYFMDSPTRLADMHIREWRVAGPGQETVTVRLALEAEANEKAVDSFAGNIQKIVNEAKGVFGEMPAYDYGSYTFLTVINPYIKGDGMEHRNSTMISIPATFANDTGFLEVFAHEYFHSWNVERIRPNSLEPFNFEKSNLSEALWIAEGFTQYYGILLMKRAGFLTEEAFRQEMAGLINAKETTPGGRNFTPVESSQSAVFRDAGVSIDRTNYPNVHTSYYFYGGALALALDLQLRQQFGASLDRFMQEMWKRFGKTEKPYTLPEVEKALAAVSSPAFAKTFFRKHVYDHQSIPYASLLEATGWQLKKAAEGKAWLGPNRIRQDKESLVVSSNTIRHTPLYEAGVDVGDNLLQLDGRDLKSEADITGILTKHKPGETLKLVFSHRDQRMESTVTLAEDPSFMIKPQSGLTAAQQAFQKSWLHSKVEGF